MDPSFLFVVSNLVRERQVANNLSRRISYEEDEKIRQEKLLEFRKQMIDNAKKESSKLLLEASQYPKETYVRSAWILIHLDINEVKPDSFIDQQDKEQAALIWRKLQNICKKCEKEMTPPIKDEVDKCLAALQELNNLKLITGKLQAKQLYEQTANKLVAALQKQRRINLFILLTIFLAIFVTFSLFIYLSTIGGLSEKSSSSIAIISVGVLVFVSLVILTKQLPKCIPSYQKLKGQYEAEAMIKNEDFWNMVIKKFSGFPSQEQLDESYKTHMEIIQAFFSEQNSAKNQEHTTTSEEE
jgi:hypothetical protein